MTDCRGRRCRLKAPTWLHLLSWGRRRVMVKLKLSRPKLRKIRGRQVVTVPFQGNTRVFFRFTVWRNVIGYWRSPTVREKLFVNQVPFTRGSVFRRVAFITLESRFNGRSGPSGGRARPVVYFLFRCFWRVLDDY